MRARDFLVVEASVFKKEKNQYVPGYRMAISTKSGGKSVDAVKAQVPGFETTEELIIVPPGTKATYQVQLSKAGDSSFKLKRPNGEVIELLGTENAIESSLNGIGPAINKDAPGQIKMPNKGDTAEALLGAAMFAKVLKRTGKNIGDVTTDDVWEIFDTMKPVSNDDYYTTAKDLGGATDKIWFRLKVKGFVKMALANPDLRKKLTAWLMSPVNYVNSEEGTNYANEFYKNGQPDELGIISDGLSAQSEKKTDVFTYVRDPVNGKVAKELLPVSLKAGAEQFAQHSGSSWKAMEDLFGKLGINFSVQQEVNIKQDYENMQTKKEQIAAASHVYKIAEGLINDQFKTPRDEAKFIKQVASAIRFWATNNDDNVRLVAFGNRGHFEVLRFDKLVPMMQKMQLRATFLSGDNPKLHIKDQVTGQLLLQIRTYIQQGKKGPYQRNVIEKGPLISTIANAIEKQSINQPQQPPAPVAKPQPAQEKPVTPTKPLGTTAQKPAKLPTKAKVQQEPAPVGSQMGAEPENTAI